MGTRYGTGRSGLTSPTEFPAGPMRAKYELMLEDPERVEWLRGTTLAEVWDYLKGVERAYQERAWDLHWAYLKSWARRDGLREDQAELLYSETAAATAREVAWDEVVMH